MGGVMIPLNLFYLWVGEQNVPSHVRHTRAEIDSSRVYQMVILEGTGFLRPEGNPKPYKYFEYEDTLRQVLAKHAKYQFNKMRHQYTYDAGGNKKVLFADDAHESEFYKTILVLATNEFSRRGWLTTLFVASPSRAKPSVGISFQDFAAGNQQIVLLPQPEMSKEDWEKMRRQMVDLAPVPALRPPTSKSATWALKKRKVIDSIVHELGEYTGGPNKDAVFVEVFAKYHIINAHFAEDIIKAVRNANTADWKFKGLIVNDRHLTDSMGSYRIVFVYV